MLNKLKLYLCIKLYPLQSVSLLEEDIIYKLINKEENKEKEEKNKKTEKLLVDLRNSVNKDFNRSVEIYNYDEVELVLKKQHSYLFKNDLSVEKYYNDCFNIIDEFTSSFISLRDGKIVYKYWNNESDEKLLGTKNNNIKVHIMEYLVRYIPIDILIVNFLVKNKNCDIKQLDGVYGSINMADALLDKVLERGVAENHLHMGAGFHFSILWEVMVNEIFYHTRQKKFKIFNNFSNSNLEQYLNNASILRVLMSSFLSNKNMYKSFEEFILSALDKHHYKILLENKLLSVEETIKISDEILGKIGVSTEKSDLTEDIMFKIFKKDIKNLRTSGENILLYNGLEYVNNSEDELFKMLFLKYIRIKNCLYSNIVQNNGINGLTSFKEYYNNATDLSGGMRNFWKIFFRYNFQNPFLTKLEGRMSIKPVYDDFSHQIFEILSSYNTVIKNDYNKNQTIPKFGLVFHFLKKRQEDTFDKCWKNYQEDRETTFKFISYKELQKKYKNELDNLLELRDSNPYLSQFLLGIDAASGENDTPVCVFAPIFKSARDGRNDVLYKPDLNTYSENGEEHYEKILQKSLMFTFHAGEDFRHILSGLRRIDEVVEHCKFHAGDRIGHGIALACDADKWQSKYLLAVLPRFEHFENLLWVWGLFSENLELNIEISMYLEREILKYAKEIYVNLNGVTVSMLHEAYLKSFEEFQIMFNNISDENYNPSNKNQNEKIFCINEPLNNNMYWNVERLIHSRNCCCFIERMEEPIFVEIKDFDLNIIKKMQTIMINKISKKGIVIEINPTSNTTLGEIDNMSKHHVFKLQNIHNDGENKKVIVNVNSDDPTIFSNNISNELAMLYYTLDEADKGKDEAIALIDRLREYGMKTSFIDDKLTDEQYTTYLERAISYLENMK